LRECEERVKLQRDARKMKDVIKVMSEIKEVRRMREEALMQVMEKMRYR
jgi:hypothetical protein